MRNYNEFRIEQSSLIQALEQYREMKTVLEEERENLQNIISQESSKWQGAAAEAAVSSMNSFLQTGEYNEAYECVRKVRLCMEDTLDQVSALLVRCEDFPKQLESDTYIESMRPACGDYTLRNGGVLYLDYGKAMVIPDLCDQISEAAEYLGTVLKQSMEDCRGIIDDIDGYQNRVDAAVRKVKRVKNYKLSFQKYVQGIKALENDVAVCLAGMKDEPDVDENSSTIVKTREFETDYNRVTERGKEILRGELEAAGYSSIEAQMIIYMIEKENPSYLSTLYALDSYGDSSSKDAVVDQIISYYELNKNPEDNLLDVVLENYRNDENISDYDVYVGYLEYLKDEYYICKAEYEEILGNLKEGEPIPEEEIRKMEDFLEERVILYNILMENNGTGNNIELEKWSKVEIVAALEIENRLLEKGYEEEFVYGVIGNMKQEGEFGTLEGLKNTDKIYGLHVIDCVNYLEKYNPYNITEVNLIELYFDRVMCTDNNHKWGIGIVQWTPDDRTEPLLKEYLRLAGYEVEDGTNNLKNIETGQIITSDMRCSVEVYLTMDQVVEAEINHLVYELTETHTEAYTAYEQEILTDNKDVNIREATLIVYDKYICIEDGTGEKRAEYAVWWSEARVQSTKW
ncbi:MAG: hypothetical protein E7284_02510 [Lachnospiraceae bacterium]|nr:hypothetical protein [Lachnospiraceae bacterium]